MNRFIDINPERCIGCGTCQSACADAHRMQGLQDTPRLALVKTGGISAALACHHCEGAPCAEVCPVNAIEHDGDRIHVKEQECIGCRLCAIACPFGAIHPDGTSIAGVAGMCDPTPSYPKSLSSLLTWAPGQYTCAVKCDLCAFDPDGPHCVATRCCLPIPTTRPIASSTRPSACARSKTVQSSTLPLWPRACPRKQKGA